MEEVWSRKCGGSSTRKSEKRFTSQCHPGDLCRGYQVKKLEAGKTLHILREKTITGRIVKVTVKE